jgi:demethylmenaquinone methyltransferase / 2-methoxy-6-polyprenyl-1,4-benzoquinol methylase
MPDDFSGPNRFARDLFAPLPARYDRLAELLSFGQNGRWRSAMVGSVLPAHGVVLDVASGTAGVALQLAAPSRAPDRAPDQAPDREQGGAGAEADSAEADSAEADSAEADSAEADSAEADGGARVVGIDLTEEMLRQGNRRVAAAGMSHRIGLVAGRAEQLPFRDGYFDALTFTYLLRYVSDPQATLTELARVLKPGGTMASLEFCVPPKAFWRSAWWAYTRLALPAGGLLLGGREWLTVGRFLGPNISAHYRRYPVAWTVEAWQEAGMTNVGTRIMSLGGGLVMWGTRAGA